MRRALHLLVLVLSSCGGGTEPSAPPPTPASPPPPADATVYEGPRGVTAIAVDADDVYFTTYGDDGVGDVERWSKRDGSLEVLTDGVLAPFGLVVSSDSLFWVEMKSGGGAIMRMKKDGGTPTKLTDVEDPDTGIVVRDGLVWYLEGHASGQLRSVPIDGGGARLPIAEVTGNALTSDGTDFFFVDGHVQRLPASGGAATPISDICFYPDRLVVDESRAYWACQDGTVRAVSKTGGEETKLFSRNVGGGNIGGLALDDANVYFTSVGDDFLARVAKSGGALTRLASNLALPGAVAVDEAFVYVAARGKKGEKKTLRRMPK